MMAQPRSRKMAPAAMAALALAGVLAGQARADDVSAWDDGTHSGARLVAGSRGGATIPGGIEFRLAPNWKTYWRTPGDSGVPPRFDFSRSDNVESVTVLWPAPVAFDDGSGGRSFGYKKQVLLPLTVVPKDAAKPVTLRAKIDYAICEKLCVPADASLELTFDNKTSTQDVAIAAAVANVPKPARIGDGNTLAVRAVHRDASNKNVIIDVVAPDRDHVRLFVEGPTPDWALPVPQLQSSSPPGLVRFNVPLEGLPPDTDAKGAALRLTLANDKDAYEIPAILN